MSEIPDRKLGLGPMALSAVYEMANVGLGHATTALSDLTGHRFDMSIPHVDSVPLETLAGYLGGAEAVCVGSFMAFDGDVEGNMAFIFPWASARKLWTILVGIDPGDSYEVSELEVSAMLEVGNILNSSFLNALSEMTGLSMHATPPLVSVEMATSIVQTIVVEAELADAVALAIDTELFEKDGGLKGTFLCIPSRQGLSDLLGRLGLEEAA